MGNISACILDCPDCCSFIAGSRAGIVRGNPDHPFTRGFTCAKGKNFIKRLESRERITRPMIRCKSGFKPVSWDQALLAPLPRIFFGYGHVASCTLKGLKLQTGYVCYFSVISLAAWMRSFSSGI